MTDVALRRLRLAALLALATLLGGVTALAVAPAARAHDAPTYPYTVTASWLLPASWDYATTPPGNVPAIWPQDRLTGDVPACRWAQVDTYRIDDARDRATFDALGDQLVNGEDSSIYLRHTFVPGPPCAGPTLEPTPEPTWTPTPEPTPEPSPTVTPEPSAPPEPTSTPTPTDSPAPSTPPASTPPSPESSGGPSTPPVPAPEPPPAAPASPTTADLPVELAATGVSQGWGLVLVVVLVLGGWALTAAVQKRRAR